MGLERTGGFETVAFCEIEEYPQKVLAKHWPEIEIYDDITNLKYRQNVDLVTAGFPCQDLSLAGKGAGLSGERSGLFWYILRTLCMVGRPGALLENVAALLNRGFSTVLGALASFGYDAEWNCIPACAVGAPHGRDRLWIVANASEKGQQGHLIDWDSIYCRDVQEVAKFGKYRAVCGPEWATNYEAVLMGDGVRADLDGIGAAGNAVVPQVVEMIGYAILEAEKCALDAKV